MNLETCKKKKKNNYSSIFIHIHPHMYSLASPNSLVPEIDQLHNITLQFLYLKIHNKEFNNVITKITSDTTKRPSMVIKSIKHYQGSSLIKSNQMLVQLHTRHHLTDQNSVVS